MATYRLVVYVDIEDAERRWDAALVMPEGVGGWAETETEYAERIDYAVYEAARNAMAERTEDWYAERATDR
jgi:hypothetical protein